MAATSPLPDNACASCGRTIGRSATLCNACEGTARSIDPVGTRKRAEWARAAAARDAAWAGRPCEFCGAGVAVGAAACGTCGRPRAFEKPIDTPPTRVEPPARDDGEGDSKRAAWARAAAERDAAWPGRSCEFCGAAVAVGAAACGTCGRLCAVEQPAPRRDTARQFGAVPAPSDPVGDRKRAEWAQAAARRDAAHEHQHAPAQVARRRRIGYLAFAGVALATTIGVLVVVLGGRARPPEATTTPIAPPESPAVRIAKAASFEQAIAIARPALVDTTDELGEGARLLATYAAAKLRWSDVAVTAETTTGRVEKDPALERGKRMCATGEILRIERRDLGGRKVYVGRLRMTDVGELAFVAVGTTGDLVKHSTGTLCGAVLGMSGSAVSILGMFDFEENRRPLVEQ